MPYLHFPRLRSTPAPQSLLGTTEAMQPVQRSLHHLCTKQPLRRDSTPQSRTHAHKRVIGVERFRYRTKVGDRQSLRFSCASPELFEENRPAPPPRSSVVSMA